MEDLENKTENQIQQVQTENQINIEQLQKLVEQQSLMMENMNKQIEISNNVNKQLMEKLAQKENLIQGQPEDSLKWLKDKLKDVDNLGYTSIDRIHKDKEKIDKLLTMYVAAQKKINPKLSIEDIYVNTVEKVLRHMEDYSEQTR